MSYYQRHAFFCTNLRENGRVCCRQAGSLEMREFAKKLSKELGIAGPGGVRVNAAGCLDRCAEGPIVVIYPEGTWYSYVDEDDVREIIESHLGRGEPVERLKIPQKSALETKS